MDVVLDTCLDLKRSDIDSTRAFSVPIESERGSIFLF